MAQLATINPLNQFFALDGSPLNNGKLYFGDINTDPEQNPVQMYWDSAGLVPALQPIRTTSGYPSRSGSPAILYCAEEYSLRVRQSNDVQVFYIPRAGSASLQTFGQWTTTTVTPSFVSTISFTVTGDQTADFQVGRRARFAVTAGTVYGTIGAAIYGSLTTVTMIMDGASVLDAGLESVDLGILTPLNPSVPTIYVSPSLLRGYIDGLIMSTAGSSATMSIGAGIAQDSAGTVMLSLSAITKTTSAWAVGTGNGGLDTGTIANSTWYHFYVIRRPDTGVTDVVFSTDAATPTLPANYTQYRYIGSCNTNGSAQWEIWHQHGDEFMRDSPVGTDINVTDQSTTPVLRAMPVPLGIKVQAIVSGYITQATASNVVKLYDPAQTALTSGGNLTAMVPSAGGYGGFNNERVWTNTSQQIYSLGSAASTTLVASLIGYVNPRGRNA